MDGWRKREEEGEGERVTDSNEAATSSGGTCGLSVRYCGTRCGTEPSSSYCRFPVINVPRRASNPCTARSSPRHLSLPLSLFLCSLPAHGISDRPWYRTTVLDIVDWYEKYLYRGNWDEAVKPGSLGVKRSRLMGLEMPVSIWNW